MQRFLATVVAFFLLIGQAFAQNLNKEGLSTDISGTITSGGSYQTIAAANSLRKNCTVQNPGSASEDLFVKLGTMAHAYDLLAGQSFSTQNGVAGATDAISVEAATTGHAFAGTCQ